MVNTYVTFSIKNEDMFKTYEKYTKQFNVFFTKCKWNNIEYKCKHLIFQRFAYRRDTVKIVFYIYTDNLNQKIGTLQIYKWTMAIKI